MGSAPQFPEPSNWHLVVTAVDDVTPHMRRIGLGSPELASFRHLPGQDMALAFIRQDGVAVRRRYTIRRFEPDRRHMELDFVIHGDGPGVRWAQRVKTGDTVDAIGPRGKITLVSEADWHLFAGDDTAVPGALAMLEALPAAVPARAFLQVDNADDRQPFDRTSDRQQVSWHYGALDGSRLPSTLAEAELPPGRGHAYLAGEVSLVLALKTALLARGWTADQISAKAYWNRGRANAGNGEPEQRAA